MNAAVKVIATKDLGFTSLEEMNKFLKDIY